MPETTLTQHGTFLINKEEDPDGILSSKPQIIITNERDLTYHLAVFVYSFVRSGEARQQPTEQFTSMGHTASDYSK